MVKRVFQRAVCTQQLDGGLFADAGNAGNVVAGIAHQALEVGNLRRGNAEILAHPFRRIAHDFAHAALGIQHVGRLRDQLHGIAVARDQQRGNTGFLTAARKRTQNVIRFERRAGENADAHLLKALAHEVKLRNQLGRGRLSACLVFAVILMAEGRPVHIECHGEIARAFVAHDLEQHGKKAENGVCKDAVLVGKRRKRMKCAVHQAVAVNGDEGI